MNYIENIYICLAAPLLIAVMSLRGNSRRTIFFLLGGMTSCLLSSYISTFIAYVQRADLVAASIEIAPMVEEFMKLMPVIFYLLVFEPSKEKAAGGILMISVGFATFENVCYLTQNGASRLTYRLIRGFGAGAMHVVCGLIISSGLWYLWDRVWLRLAGIVGLLSFAIMFHAIYNILVSQTGIAAAIGYLIPLTVTVLMMCFSIKTRLYSRTSE